VRHHDSGGAVHRDREAAFEAAPGTQPASEWVRGGAPMPYEKLSDLPKAQVDQYSHHQKEAFLEAFNSALEQYGEESRAFAVAHAAAQRTPEKDPTPGD
jgi:cation transport regulator